MNRMSSCIVILTLVVATSAYGDSSGIEENRRELCKLLPKEDHCVELKKLFGAPPPNTVSNTESISVCTNNTCRAVNAFPKAGSLPSNTYIKTEQTLTITTKNAGQKTWRGQGSFYPAGAEGFDGNSVSYDVEFDLLHKFFWVQESLYEGGSDIWISYETGKTYIFDGQPRMSPDGNFLLIPEESMDDVKQLFIRICSLTDREIVEVAKFEMTSEIVSGRFIWINADEIAVISHVRRKHTFEDVVTARIRRLGSKWILLKEKTS